MDRLPALVVVGALFLPLAGCAGTLISRSGGKFIGAYPYQAIATDSVMIAAPVTSSRSKYGEPDVRWLGPVFGLLSLPLDLAVDTALLPADVIAWPFGWKKNPLQSLH